jgi:hypothetical protein
VTEKAKAFFAAGRALGLAEIGLNVRLAPKATVGHENAICR